MIAQFLSHDIAYAFAWTLVHSVWQITLVAVILGLVLKFSAKGTAHSRYLLAFSALGVTILTALVTFTIYLTAASGNITSVVANFSGEFLSPAPAEGNNLLGLIDTYQAVILKTWLLGSIFFFVKLIGGYAYIKRVAKQAIIEDDQLAKKLSKLKAKFKIHRDIVVKSSVTISTPMVVGYLKPVILFPIGLVNQLTGEEVAAILAHELAHIKRHDFLFNLIQSIAEAVFYFHPGMWYISNSISRERENSCDDMAIHYTGNKVSYAKTLIKLQEMKIKGMQPVLAMAGRTGSFSDRIKRILDLPVQSHQLKEKLVAVLLLSLTMVGFAKDTNDKPQLDADELDVYIIDDCPQDISEIKYYVDTIPERNNFHVKRSSKNKNMELKMEDGEIKELKIDGELVPESEYDKLDDIIVELTPNGQRDMITVFPDCGDAFGNIYYLNKNKQPVKLDSILGDVTARMKQFEDFKLDKFDFHIDKFDNLFIDSLRKEVNSLDISALTSKNRIKIDSILDLLPNKLQEFELLDLQTPTWVKKNFAGPSSSNNLFESFVLPAKDKESTVYDEIANSLIKDDFVATNKVSKVQLTAKHMKIDGEKQPSNIYNKYKNIFEKHTGLKLNKSTQIELLVDPTKVKEQKMFPYTVQ